MPWTLMQKIDNFRKNKQHIAVISIDIKGAFHNLQYHLKIDKIRTSNIQYIFESLLENRRIVIPTNEGLAQQTQTRGCPQGSCSGPALWNLVVDEALNAAYPANTDFFIVAAAESERGLGKAA
ncbi:hypothetical protein AVEN_233386-1 [Araneus ventricosus]|uniref:Reverse transcriptase domain-containing protein n=1 Tax=Araneus ventricosus TaxID=182803 RepID=A0A4Y2MJ00_ARAVE|nr:hypothetical protein AVEN_233386-1 [Araneus ventricosus]